MKLSPLATSEAPPTLRPDDVPDMIAGRAVVQSEAAAPLPFKVAALAQAELLTAAELHLAAECRVQQIAEDKLIVKYDPARTYLTMTPGQWRAMRYFGEGRAVPQVIFQAIVDRACPPLREFYELVVKAHACGILQVAGQAGPAPVRPARWDLKIAPHSARWAGVTAVLFGLAAVCVRPLVVPANVAELLTGWLLLCAALSAGQGLGASVVRDAKAEIYHGRLHWRTLCPHLRFDLEDAIMAGPGVVVDAAMGRLAPTFLLLGAAALWLPGSAMVLFCGALALLSPFWWSPGMVVVHGLYGTRHLDALRQFRFNPNRELWYALTTRLKHTNYRFLGIHSLYGTVWLVLVLLAAALGLRANAEELWQAYVRANGLHFTALAFLSLLGLAVAAVLGVFATVGVMIARREWEKHRRRQRRPRPAQVSAEATCAALGDSVLFRTLPAEDRAAIAAAVQIEEFPAHATVITEGETGDRLFIVYSGELEVLRHLSSGAEDAVATLRAGDVFGEIALLNACRRSRTVRTLQKSVLLSLSAEAFRRLVMSKVSRDAVEDTIQKIGYLQRIPLASAWSPHAMAAFARRAVFRDFPEGTYVIREGEDNDYFYMLYEGELSVRKARQEIARLGVGDFFGEISLLQNSLAKATIVARTPARCLVLNKREFLQFLSNDFVLGLQFEEISSKRLGHAIFPLKAGSFDVLRA